MTEAVVIGSSSGIRFETCLLLAKNAILQRIMLQVIRSIKII